MSEDLTGLIIPAKTLSKVSRSLYVPDPAPIIAPITAARETSPTYRGDTLVTPPVVYTTTSAVSSGSPARWLLADDGTWVYIPPSAYHSFNPAPT